MKATTHLYNFKFECPKCGSTQYQLDKFQAASSFWYRDFPNQKFTTVTCTGCFYTELYKIPFKEFSEMTGISKS